MAHDHLPGDGMDHWDRVASELRACRESQQRAYGDVDPATLGRYLAGESAEAERAAVEAALHDHPDLRLLTDLVKDVLGSLEPVEVPAPGHVPETAEAPSILPFPKQAVRKPRQAFWRRGGPILAAAGLLIAVGVGLPAALGALPVGGRDGRDPLALADRRGVAGRGGAGLLALGQDKGIADRMLSAPVPPPELDLPELDHGPPAGAVASAGTAPPALREARTYFHAGERARAQGDWARASAFHHKAAKACEAGRVPQHSPDAVNAVLSRAEVLQLAINSANGAKKDDPQLATLRERIAGAASDPIPDVVPTLAGALRYSRDCANRRGLATALGKIGPAAAPALPVMIACLIRSEDAGERRALLEAIQKIGPAARPALPALRALAGEAPAEPELAKGAPTPAPPPPGGYQARKAMMPRPLPAAERGLAKVLVAALSGTDGRVGIKDTAGRCSVKAARDGTEALRSLASQDGVEVLVEILPPGGRHNDPAAEWKLVQMGERGAVVILDPSANTARVYLSATLRAEKFPAEATAKAIGAALASGGCDKAVVVAREKLAAAKK